MNTLLRRVGQVFLTALLVFPLLFALSMNKHFSHDEHQHIAAGALFARHSLLPYKDFPYFHTPHLVFVYGWLFRLSDHLLLTARAFSAACGALTAGIMFAAAWSVLRAWRFRLRLAAAVAATLLLLSAPVFLKTTGSAWNHDPSVLFALLSVLLVIEAAPRGRSGLCLLAAGVCLGLSVGFRITFAPIALPLLCIIGFAPSFAGRSRIALLAGFSLGALAGLAPFFWLLAIAPEQTLFCNFEFARINILYRFATETPRTMTLPSKLRYLLKEEMTKNLALLLALLTTLVFYWRNGRRRAERFPLLSLAAMLPFVLAGSLAPSPLYYQYFYAPVPFLILAIIYAAASLPEHPQTRLPAGIILSCLLSFSVGLAMHSYEGMVHLFAAADWRTMRMHRDAREFTTPGSSGPVLTLAPTAPLEAGLEIYPAFSTGPFAWRVAPFIEAQKRKRLGIVSEAELGQYLSERSPGAIFVGDEQAQLEGALVRYAREHGYQPHPFMKEHVLWLRPEGAPSQPSP